MKADPLGRPPCEMPSHMGGEAELLGTGINALDRLMGGGLPARQVMLIAGQPGSGKTILASQLAFAQAVQGVPVLLATAASEPHTKMLESLRGFTFYRRECVGREIFLLSVYPWLRKGVKEAREMLLSSVRERKARLLVLDGLRSLRDVWQNEATVREFLAEIGVGLATNDCTAVLTLESAPERTLESPEAATVDGVVNLMFGREGMRRTRHIEVVKVRGRRPIPGEHAAHLDHTGFDFTVRIEEESFPRPLPQRQGRIAMGVKSLDAHLSGGVPASALTLLIGAGGAGKSLLAYAFANAEAAAAVPSLFVTLEESDKGIVDRARAAGIGRGDSTDVWAPEHSRDDPDRIVRAIVERANSHGARRVVMDGVDLLMNDLSSERRGAFAAALHRALRQEDRDVLWTADVHGPLVRELARAADNVLEVGFTDRQGDHSRELRVRKLRAAASPRTTWAFDISAHGIGGA